MQASKAKRTRATETSRETDNSRDVKGWRGGHKKAGLRVVSESKLNR